MGLGGDGTAECFATDGHRDIDDRYNDENGCNAKILLQNLDGFPYDELDDDEIEIITHNEYWGNNAVPVIYNKTTKIVTVLGKSFLVDKIYR